MSDDFDLYSFPKDHVGRKRYIGVKGHSKSIPIPYLYYGADGHYHVLPEYGGTWDGLGNASAMVMRDMDTYQSPLDGSMISSRSSHRDHMRKHEVIEVGNERVGHNVQDSGPRVGYSIKDALDRARAMPEHAYRQHMQDQQRNH